jgi:hypothetical protein
MKNLFTISILSAFLGFTLISSSPQASPNAVYRFNLTKLLGKPLLKPATFTVDPSSTRWVLNMNNGKSITYTIISGNSADALCGLSAKDSLGDFCEICVRAEPNDAVTVVFEYGKHKYIYTGNFIR